MFMFFVSFMGLVALAQEAPAQPSAPLLAPPSKTATANLLALELDRPLEGEITDKYPVVHTRALDKGYADAPVRGKSYRLHFEKPGAHAIELRSYFIDAYVQALELDAGASRKVSFTDGLDLALGR